MKLKSTFCMLIMMSIVTLVSGQNIFNAIANGNLELVRKILTNDPVILESKQENEMTPLMYAASQGKTDIVRYLIENGADINYKRSDGPSSLLFSAMFSHEDVVRLLVENGAEVNSGNGQDAPIFKAIEYGTKEIAEYLVKKGANVPVNNFLFHQAAAGGMSKIVDHMIHKGIDLNSLNANGGTLLHSASKGGLLNLAKQMISKGAKIDQRNRYGLVPLHIASSLGHVNLVKFLIHRGANIYIKTYSGLSSFALAESNAHHDVMKLLEIEGADTHIGQFMDVPGDLYFGLDKPGLNPELFAPGIITTEVGEHGTVAISPDGNEIYWQSGPIKYIKRIDGKWTFPDTVQVFEKYQAKNPVFSYDGKKIYFHSRMSLEKDGQFKDFDIWYVERNGLEWSEPVNLGTNVNSDGDERFPCVAQNGNLYFSLNRDIYRSRYQDGRYLPREKLNSSINSEYREQGSCIAPDESFLIFNSRRPGGISTNIFYVCFRKKDDSWSEPVVMSDEINKGNALFPGLSPDGKYLFFVSLRTGWLDLYWVDTKIIDELKPEQSK